MRARKPDPVVAAWDRLQAADKAFSNAYDERDEVEARARAAGFKPGWPCLRVGGYGCYSVAEVQYHARGLPKAEAANAVQAMRSMLAVQRQQRRLAGLMPLDAAYKRADREWRAAMEAMGTTRATTATGVIFKLKLIAIELRDGDSGFGEGILASAIADLARIGRRER